MNLALFVWSLSMISCLIGFVFIPFFLKEKVERKGKIDSTSVGFMVKSAWIYFFVFLSFCGVAVVSIILARPIVNAVFFSAVALAAIFEFARIRRTCIRVSAGEKAEYEISKLFRIMLPGLLICAFLFVLNSGVYVFHLEKLVR
jgi:hypothetical protein